MKKVIMISLGVIVCGVLQAQTVAMRTEKAHIATVPSAPVFNWHATTFDFGTISAGVPVSHVFTFTNKGGEPLLITSVKASCGCTVADYSKDPIPAGQEGFVKATFNAAKAGAFTKTVTVLANTEEGTVLLTIKGTVQK